MATVFRVEKNRGYTVMSNFHLNDKNISLKAKGLMSQMLSLPDTWDYTLKGLSTRNKESVDAIRTAVLELEKYGYVIRRQSRDASGKLAGIEYTIYEQPQVSPQLDFPITVNPTTDNPISEKPVTDNPTQSITYQANTQRENTQGTTTHPSIATGPQQPHDPLADRIDTMEAYREIIYENIEYDILCTRYGKDRLDEIAALMLDAVCSQKPTIRIGGEDKPTEIVKNVLLKLGSFHIEYVLDCLDKTTTKIHNVKSYLLTALYNAPMTMDHYYQNAVNHDLYRGGD